MSRAQQAPEAEAPEAPEAEAPEAPEAEAPEAPDQADVEGWVRVRFPYHISAIGRADGTFLAVDDGVALCPAEEAAALVESHGAMIL